MSSNSPDSNSQRPVLRLIEANREGIRVNRERMGELEGKLFERLDKLYTAVAETRDGVRSVEQGLGAHVEFCDWNRRRVDSDIRQLREAQRSADDTGRQLVAHVAASGVRNEVTSKRWDTMRTVGLALLMWALGVLSTLATKLL